MWKDGRMHEAVAQRARVHVDVRPAQRLAGPADIHLRAVQRGIRDDDERADVAADVHEHVGLAGRVDTLVCHCYQEAGLWKPSSGTPRYGKVEM